jgi:hypothetical protein
MAAETCTTVSKKALRDAAGALAKKWFGAVSKDPHVLQAIEQKLVQQYDDGFKRLLKLSAPSNLRTSYLKTLDSLRKRFRDELVMPFQTQSHHAQRTTLLSDLLKSLPSPEESDYLKEAVDCAEHNYYRASAVLGWCAAIDRIHRAVERIGFGQFNTASTQMASEVKGRFKKFSSAQHVNSISELREVFDTVLLWILEGMGLIDINQHTRLRSCFDLRCQCGHPGDAPITEYNLLSFYSDLNEIVFKNNKFSV